MRSPAKKPVTVYVAEDHVAIRDLLVRHLEMLPEYEVVGQSSDGRVAAAECSRLQPQLLLLDLGLPEMAGLEVARVVAGASPKTQILVFSARFDPATVRQALEAGVRGIVEKTAPFDTLAAAIAAVADGRAFFGEAITQALQRSFSDPNTTRSEDGLTPREREVLQLVAEGRSNKEVAERLRISVKTAENHRHNLMRKLEAHNGADLTREAFRLGLVQAASV